MSVNAPMTSHTQTNTAPCARSRGFVVAMRAKLINAYYPDRFEWVIVSRWGTEGEHLSIGWTHEPALAGEAPLHLSPNQTSLAVLPRETAAETPAVFQLAPTRPNEITVAGEFLPAEGYVRLYGAGLSLRVRVKGQCLSCTVPSTWQIEATRAAWLGEFIEPGAVVS
jgi:hypothetical protein